MRLTRRIAATALVVLLALCCGAGIVSPGGMEPASAASGSCGYGPAVTFDTTGNVFWQFAVGTNGYVYYRDWSGSGFGSWHNLGNGGVGLVGKPGVAFNRSTATPTEVCVAGSNGYVYRYTYNGSSWTFQGNVPGAAGIVGGIALTFNASGAVSGRFMVGSDGVLYGQTGPTWTWMSFGCPSGGLWGGPVVSFNETSGAPLEILAAHGTNGNLYGRPVNGGSWTSYGGGESGPLYAFKGAGAVAATWMQDGSIVVHNMVRNYIDLFSGYMYSIVGHQYNYNGLGWSSWQSHGGPPYWYSGTTVTFYSSGVVPGLPREEYVIKSNGHLYGRAYNDGYWGSWNDQGSAGGGFK